MAYKDIEKKKGYNRRYYQKNRESRREKDRRYHQANREKISLSNKKYYQENRERIQKYNVLYYQENRDLILQRSRDSFERWKKCVKEVALYHYGGNKLACIRCGFSNDVRALTLDHINDDGAAERKLLGKWSSIKLYSLVIKKGFPSGYQTLCMNCQMIKELDRRARLKKGVGKE